MDNDKYYDRKLKREQEKLWLMIDEAMDEPIALNEAILKQSRIVDELIARVQGVDKTAKSGIGKAV